jgi:surface carbohydrate biosynthesis protein (TIGR04326 family)
MDRTLFVIEGADPPALRQNGVVAYWSTLATTDASFSIPAIVERTGLELRREYLAWVHDLGNAPVKEGLLRKFLIVKDSGLSAWWLNRIADKSPLNSTSIYEVFKLRALEHLYLDQGCNRLVYGGADKRLHRTLKSWCVHLGHAYIWSRSAHRAKHSTIPAAHRWGRRLPHLAQAFAFLTWKLCARYVPTWLRGRHEEISDDSTDRALIVTYFPNFDLEEARQGHFRSAYWKQLHDLLDELPVAPTWIWIHGDTAQCNFRQAMSWRDLFNAHPTRTDRHFLLEEFATPKALLDAIRSYMRLYLRGLALKSMRRKFILADSTLNFYPMFEREWKSSFFGTAAIDGLLFHSLFDSMIRRLPQQRWGLYVWENQPWESALVGTWHRYQNHPIIGHQHIAMKPMDLRAISDERTYCEKGRSARPLPDFLAINGRGALDLLRAVQYPEDRLAVVEALRYPHLPRRVSREDADPRTLLVICGYLESEAVVLLRVLNEAADAIRLAGYARIRIKSHPFGPASMRFPKLPSALEHEVVSAPLERLWSDAAFAVIANSSTAAVEALYAGIPIAICESEDNFNLSPLYGHPAVPFVTTGEDLAAVLAAPRCALLPDDYFLVSERPNCWKDLLLQAGHTRPTIRPDLPD